MLLNVCLQADLEVLLMVGWVQVDSAAKAAGSEAGAAGSAVEAAPLEAEAENPVEDSVLDVSFSGAGIGDQKFLDLFRSSMLFSGKC